MSGVAAVNLKNSHFAMDPTVLQECGLYLWKLRKKKKLPGAAAKFQQANHSAMVHIKSSVCPYFFYKLLNVPEVISVRLLSISWVWVAKRLLGCRVDILMTPKTSLLFLIMGRTRAHFNSGFLSK